MSSCRVFLGSSGVSRQKSEGATAPCGVDPGVQGGHPLRQFLVSRDVGAMGYCKTRCKLASGALRDPAKVLRPFIGGSPCAGKEIRALHRDARIVLVRNIPCKQS